MTNSFILFHHRLVTLGILLLHLRLSTIVKQELRFFQIFLVTCCQIESCQGHLGNLVARNYTRLTGIRSYLLANQVGKPDGNIQEFTTACSLIMSYGPFYHVSQVV